MRDSSRLLALSHRARPCGRTAPFRVYLQRLFIRLRVDEVIFDGVPKRSFPDNNNLIKASFNNYSDPPFERV